MSCLVKRSCSKSLRFGCSVNSHAVNVVTPLSQVFSLKEGSNARERMAVAEGSCEWHCGLLAVRGMADWMHWEVSGESVSLVVCVFLTSTSH